MKKKIIIIIGFLAIVIAAAAIFSGQFWKHGDQGVIALSGNVEVTESDAGFKISGKVLELLTDEGLLVQKGDKIAAVDSAELESLAAQSRAVLGEASARLEELKTGSRPQEIAQAAANVKAAEAELVKAQKDFERAERLFRNEAIAASQFDAAKSAYDSRAEQVKAAAEQLSMVREGARKEVIVAAEDRVRQARASLRVAQERLGYAVLFAPVSGVVLKKNVELGEVVQPGTPIFTIGEIEDPWVKVYVKEDKLALVKLGQRATVSVDSYPGKTYEGHVSYISSQAEFTPKTVQTQEERVKLVFGIKVKVKNINRELKPGMPADVKIFIK
ncbi:MAG TPA: efflux RND transporter periplasmic adaptor subunit [Dissulfurispiraceae bacterium]|nr:efflux RND transporter periplasmic adaptor subunit [Dissulfurispiraceae bacterium]